MEKAKVEAAAERFLRKVNTVGKTRSLRKTAEGARGSLETLEADLAKAEVRDELAAEERVAIVDVLESMRVTVSACLEFLHPPKPEPAGATMLKAGVGRRR